jgi:hypothetical protein
MNSQPNKPPELNRAHAREAVPAEDLADLSARLNELLERGELLPEAFAEYSTTVDRRQREKGQS